MPLRFLENEFRSLLDERGRSDLMEAAVGRIGFTDDGGTIYVHLHPRPGWRGRAQGRVFVLAWEDYVPDGGNRLRCYRWLVTEARRSLRENPDKIIRWLEGR
jgi:hypothetical protein